jgi:hypothetical protein
MLRSIPNPTVPTAISGGRLLVSIRLSPGSQRLP